MEIGWYTYRALAPEFWGTTRGQMSCIIVGRFLNDGGDLWLIGLLYGARSPYEVLVGISYKYPWDCGATPMPKYGDLWG